MQPQKVQRLDGQLHAQEHGCDGTCPNDSKVLTNSSTASTCCAKQLAQLRPACKFCSDNGIASDNLGGHTASTEDDKREVEKSEYV